MYDALVANVCFMIHRYLWFETEVTARRDAPPIESAMHRGIFLPLMELMGTESSAISTWHITFISVCHFGD